MRRFERARDRRAFGRRLAALLTLLAMSFAGCVSVLSLDEKRCPCAAGYDCCEATQTCLRRGETCLESDGGSSGSGAPEGGHSGASGGARSAAGGAGSAAGGAGSASGGTTGAEGGTEPQAGTGDGSGGVPGGSGGSAGSAGTEAGAGGAEEPEWRRVGSALHEEPPTTSEPDFELAPDGTPYLAFRGCEDCNVLLPSAGEPERTRPIRIPVVERFDGSWRLLPSDGLPAEIVFTPALALDGDGTPYLLTDGRVSVFDGARWSSVAPDVPAPLTTESNFRVDAQGAFWATVIDSTRDEVSVLRSSGGAWEPVGPPVLGRPTGVRLVARDGELHLSHTDVSEERVFVRRFTGSDWEASEFPGESVDIAVASNGTLFAAVRQWNDDVTLFSGAVGGFVEIGALRASWAAPTLTVAPEGTLYATFLMDSYVNVARWDGRNFRGVGTNTLGTGNGPLLRFSAATGAVPFLAYHVGFALEVKKYE